MRISYVILLFLLCSIFSPYINGQSCNLFKCYDDKSGKHLPCITQPDNVSLKRNITATNTCGQKEKERFCELNPGKCGFCNASNPSEKHPTSYLVDGNPFSWWQSQNWRDMRKAGLAGTKNNPPKVNITLSFGKSYILSGRIEITFHSERPAAMVIERSVDDGHTWETLQYYSKKCKEFYGMETENSINPAEPFKARCVDAYSQEYPKKYGLVKYIGENRYDRCTFLDRSVQEGLLATNIRIRLEYPATDGLEFRFNEEFYQKYFYAITNIYVSGRCNCFGHAITCTGPRMGRICSCKHNTMGKDCELCQPLFNDRPWMAANQTHANECKECHCNNRGIACKYNATLGHGLCTGCRNNSEGGHCENCVDKYYRDLSKPLDNTGACIACNCYPDGITNNGSCLQNATLTQVIGQCSCKPMVYGRRCDKCTPGYWGFTLPPKGECRACNCSTLGTKSASIECNQLTGQCNCKSSIHGQYCDECKHEYYKYPSDNREGCRRCPCDLGGAYSGCHTNTGSCHCRLGVEGHLCTIPSPNRFSPFLDYLQFEAEYADGTFRTVTPESGMGLAFTGRGFGQLSSDSKIHFKGINVTISHNYSVAVRYSASGQCTQGQVNLNITGPNLNKQETIPASSLHMSHGQAGIIPDLVAMVSEEVYDIVLTFSGTSECSLWIDSVLLLPYFNTTRTFTMSSKQHQDTLQRCLLTRSALSIINTEPINCSRLVFSTNAEIYNGTLECHCNAQGSNNGSYCMQYGGQCLCKPGVAGRTCNLCIPGYYGFSNTGCTKCSCSAAGSLSSVCNVQTGSCSCKENVEGTNCDRCKVGYFNIDVNNIKGCQSCFGFGHSTSCTSASEYVQAFVTTRFSANSSDPLSGWRTVDKHGNSVVYHVSWNDGLMIATSPSLVENIYLQAPDEYLGDKLQAYKQKLEVYIQPTNSNASIINASEVIFEGRRRNMTLSLNPSPSPEIITFTAIIDEEHVTSPNNTTSFDVQSVLFELKSMRFLAPYLDSGSVTIKSISMGYALKKTGASMSEEVKFVENATCLRNYTGLSCQKCAKGYKREIPYSDPSGLCILCSCNGRSLDCEPQSGNCTNCQIGTYGDRCQYCENNVLGPNCTECKAGFWGLSRSGCKACSCHTPGTWYTNSTTCDKFTGQCACNVTMNVAGRQCDRCKENSYNASEGISDCRECSSCYAFLQTDVHQLRPQVAQLTNLTIDQANHPAMQHSTSFDSRLQTIVEKARQLFTEASVAGINDSVVRIKWMELGRRLDNMQTKLMVNLSSVVNASADIGFHVEVNYKNINVTINEITELISSDYKMLNTTIKQHLDTVGSHLVVLNTTAVKLDRLLREANRLLNLTLHHNVSLHASADFLVKTANQAGINAKNVQESHRQIAPYLPQLLVNATETKKLGEEAKKMAEHRLRNATSVLNETQVVYQRAGIANPNNTKTVALINARWMYVLAASADYIRKVMDFWNSSNTVIIKVNEAVVRAQMQLATVEVVKQNVTDQRANVELTNHIAKNATELAKHVHKEANLRRDILKNFKSLLSRATIRANISLLKEVAIQREINDVLTNATSVNASIQEALVSSRQSVYLVTETKKRTEEELKAIGQAQERAERLNNETKAKENVIANQTALNYIRTEIEPVEKLCKNLSDAAQEISTKASVALRQANETDTRSRQIIGQLKQASNDSSSLFISSNDNGLKTLEREINRVRQRFVDLNLDQNVSKLRSKLQDHKSKHEEFRNRQHYLRSEIDEMKKLIGQFKIMGSEC